MMAHFFESGKYKDGDSIEKISLDLIALNNKKNELLEKFEEGKNREFMKNYFTGRAFVQFNTENDKQ